MTRMLRAHPVYRALTMVLRTTNPAPTTTALQLVVKRHCPALADRWIVCGECGCLSWPPPNDPATMWSDAVYPCHTIRDIATTLGLDVDALSQPH